MYHHPSFRLFSLRFSIPFQVFNSTSSFRRNQSPLRSTSPLVNARRLSHTSADTSKLEDLPARLVTAALPFIPTHGFSSSAILAAVASQPELKDLDINHLTLSGLFPSTTSSITNIETHQTELIGPSKALAQRWIDEGNHKMKSTIKAENLTLQKHGIHGLKRAFEIRLDYNRTIPQHSLIKALALIVTPADPFWGARLPIEPPHIIPYGSHAFKVAAAALAGLQDYSKSREWMLRRIRLAGVYSAAELMFIGDNHPPTLDLIDLERLLHTSESLATHVGNTFEFLDYVKRSQQSIFKSLWLI